MNPTLSFEDREFCEALKKTVDDFVSSHPGYDPARAVGMVFGNAIGWMTDVGLSENVILEMCRHAIHAKTMEPTLS